MSAQSPPARAPPAGSEQPDIARPAVGIATLYRHFPSREVLVLAVYRYEVQQLVDAAPVLLESRPPIIALREWMNRLAHYGVTKAGLADALSTATTSHDGLAAEAYGPVIGALSMLLHANEQAGTIRAGLDPDDVLLIMGFRWRIDPNSDWRSRADRLLDLLMAGLCADAIGPKEGVDRQPAGRSSQGRKQGKRAV
jgi:AcrR family transcriptional regulator